MPGGPPIDDPELLQRLAMDDREFTAYLREVAATLPPRRYERGALTRALGYPWERPAGSCLLAGGRIRGLAEMGDGERKAALAEQTGGDTRVPLLAIGSNASPEVLERKLAHLDAAADRELLVLLGTLHDFDIGFAAHPALYGSMPATPFESPGTVVEAALLWVTKGQLTQLAWSELNYRLGRLRARFEAEEGVAVGEPLAFVSRFGSFRDGGGAVAQAAIPAGGRTASQLSQGEAMEAAASLAFGEGSGAEDLVRAMAEDFAATLPKLAATVNREAVPLEGDRWTPLPGSETLVLNAMDRSGPSRKRSVDNGTPH